MAKFAYNNNKNANTGHTPFQLNSGYYSYIFFKKDTNCCSQLKTINKLSIKLQKLIIVYRKNLYHAQNFQKNLHNKHVKPKNYAPSDKFWLNNKYIKTKQNQKLEAKFFRPFQVLHPVGKQVYKFEFSKQLRINNVFYVSFLEQNSIKKEWVDENITKLKFEADNSKKYKVKAIWNSAVYAHEAKSHLLGLYYLVA